MAELPHSRDPHMLQQQTLLFDNVDMEEVTALTPDDEAANFLVTFQKTFRPLTRFESYFKSSAKGVDHIFLEVKRYYKRLVVEGDWSEKKYAKALVMIFETNSTLNIPSLDKVGLRVDRDRGGRRRRRL